MLDQLNGKTKETKICVFGDSITRGVVLDENGKYVFLKESFISLLESSGRYIIENFSKFGCTVDKGIAMMRKCEKEISESDITLLEFGGNDCDFDWKAVSDDPYYKHIPKTPIELFSELYAKAIERIRELGSTPVMLTPPPIDAEKYFRHFSVDLVPERVLIFLGNVMHISRWQEMYSIAASRVARELSVPLIDIRSPFLARPDFDSLICSDGIHPSTAGHRLMFGALRDAFDPGCVD
ncbi:MAG TPA: SGNH/GDSL hydrolase family protein [Bacillota bacterium]|nr:SGNH/GDSL hydrolase family protein [Bacillota bacterium]